MLLSLLITGTAAVINVSTGQNAELSGMNSRCNDFYILNTGDVEDKLTVKFSVVNVSVD